MRPDVEAPVLQAMRRLPDGLHLQEVVLGPQPPVEPTLRYRGFYRDSTARLAPDHRMTIQVGLDGRVRTEANDSAIAVVEHLPETATNPADAAVAERCCGTVAVAVASGAAAAIVYGAANAGISGALAKIAGHDALPAMWKSAVPGAMIGALAHGALPAIEASGFTARRALSLQENRAAHEMLREFYPAQTTRLEAYARSGRRKRLDYLAGTIDLADARRAAVRAVLSAEQIRLADDLASMSPSHRTRLLGLAGLWERCAPGGRAKTAQVVREQANTLGNSGTNPYEAAATLGRIGLATAQSAVVAATRGLMLAPRPVPHAKTA